MSLAGVAATGDRRAALEELRDRIALEIDGCRNNRDPAALPLKFTDLARIDHLWITSSRAGGG